MGDPSVDQPIRRSDVEHVDVDGELILWDPRTREVHRLDPVGSLLWAFFDGEASVDDLAADAADVWGVERDAALAAVRALVYQLRAARLLVDATPDDDVRTTHLVDPPSP